MLLIDQVFEVMVTLLPVFSHFLHARSVGEVLSLEHGVVTEEGESRTSALQMLLEGFTLESRHAALGVGVHAPHPALERDAHVGELFLVHRKPRLGHARRHFP